jgi:uncharacterized protein (TIGR04255 family)
MKLPTEITPNPLILTPIEIRFVPKNTNINLISELFPIFSKDLPMLDNLNQIPKEIREKNPQLMFQPDFRLRNEKYSISFGNNILLIEILGDYPLWKNYFSFIKDQVNKFLEIGILQNIIRIGVRYGSIFQNNEINQVLQYLPKISVPGYSEKISHSKFDLIKGEINLHLQVAENAILEKPGKTLVGVYVDIDASYLLPVDSNDKIITIIDQLHTAEKELFYQILKPEFLVTLNPKY